MKTKTYEVGLSNDHCLFDLRGGFESIEEAIEWSLGRGYSYVMQISEDYDVIDTRTYRCISVSVNGDNQFGIFNGWYWEHFNRKMLAAYLRKNL